MTTSPFTDRQLQVTLVIDDAIHGGTHRVQMDRPSLVIGRGSAADLQLSDLGLSRRHCQFNYFDGRLTVEDLGSRNGTFVNARQIDRSSLVDGDQVRCGNMLIGIELREPGEAVVSDIRVLEPDEVDYDEVVPLAQPVDELVPPAGDTTEDEPPAEPLSDFDTPIESPLPQVTGETSGDTTGHMPTPSEDEAPPADTVDQPSEAAPAEAEEPPTTPEPAHLAPLPEYDDQQQAPDDNVAWVDRALADTVPLPLHDAARRGKRELVIFLIGRGASMTRAEDDFGATPLHFAMASGNEPAVAYLLDKGADHTARDRRDLTPLDWARIEGHTRLVDEMTLRFKL